MCDEIDDMIEEQQELLLTVRNKYIQKRCQAVGTDDDGDFFFLMLYQEEWERTYTARLDEGNVRQINKWCENWLSTRKGLIGYG